VERTAKKKHAVPNAIRTLGDSTGSLRSIMGPVIMHKTANGENTMTKSFIIFSGLE
jgi:hypothetical protein